MITLHLAPLQGYTDAEYRRAFADIFGVPDAMYTPFLRVEKGAPAARTLRDIDSVHNDGLPVIPQIIFRNADEFDILADTLKERGHRRIDLNLGCPFPPVAGKGMGAGMLAHPDIFQAVAHRIAADNDVEYSVKMRVGYDSPNQWKPILDILNALSLTHIAVHPRTARQQYRGDLHIDAFEALLAASKHPVIFNGEIHTPTDISQIIDKYPTLGGVMVGRGVLARPSLFSEWRSGEELCEEERMAAIMRLFERYRSLITPRLCGKSQIEAKLRPFWDYPEVPHKNKFLKTLLS